MTLEPQLVELVGLSTLWLSYHARTLGRAAKARLEAGRA